MAVQLDVLTRFQDRRDDVLDRCNAPDQRRHRVDKENRLDPVAFEQVELVSDADRAFGGNAGNRACEIVLPRRFGKVSDKTRGILGVDGDVDALFHAAEPRAFTAGHPKIKRLFSDSRATERDYYSRTGIFPIMHAVAMRNDIIEAHPWLPEAVFNAYSQAKQMQYEAMRVQWIYGTLPWYGQELEATRALMGANFWPYGVEANRKTLEALFQYSYEQGLAKKNLKIEDLFHPSTLNFKEA